MAEYKTLALGLACALLCGGWIALMITIIEAL